MIGTAEMIYNDMEWYPVLDLLLAGHDKDGVWGPSWCVTGFIVVLTVPYCAGPSSLILCFSGCSLCDYLVLEDPVVWVLAVSLFVMERPHCVQMNFFWWLVMVLLPLHWCACFLFSLNIVTDEHKWQGHDIFFLNFIDWGLLACCCRRQHSSCGRY